MLQLSDVQASKRNIMKAIEAGIFTPSTKDRLLELEAQEEALNASIASHEIQKPSLTRDQIIYWLYTFKDGNIHNEDFRLELTSTFINSVYVDKKKWLSSTITATITTLPQCVRMCVRIHLSK